MDRQITIFAPTNSAVERFTGARDENLVLNHMTNVAIGAEQMEERISTLVTGNPPLWVSRDRRGIFVNQAQIITANLDARSESGEQQTLHMIDSVLDPLVPIAVRDPKYFINLDAHKLLTKSSLYNLGGHRTLVFNSQAATNERTSMFR